MHFSWRPVMDLRCFLTHLNGRSVPDVYLKHQSWVNTLSPMLSVANLTSNLDYNKGDVPFFYQVTNQTLSKSAVRLGMKYMFHCRRQVKSRLKNETPVCGTPRKMMFPLWIIRRISLTKVRCLYSTPLLPPLSPYRVSKSWSVPSALFM